MPEYRLKTPALARKVVGLYRKIEQGTVLAYKKIEDRFVDAFLEKVAAGERFMTGCRHCIKTCDPKTAPYCITRALINAAMGDVDNGLLFCGSNAWRAQKIERTVDIMEEMA